MAVRVRRVRAKPPAARSTPSRTSLFAAATRVAMDALDVPAFLIRRSGSLVLSNKKGVALLAREREATLGALKQAVAVESDAYTLHAVSAPGVPVHYLAVKGRTADPRARALHAARAWRLTPRQTEVLLLLLAGEANKSIASRLGCAEKTVEIHVGQILSRSKLPGRALVLAHLLHPAEDQG